MTIYSKFKSIIAVVLLSSFGSFADADADKSAEENERRAPEATAAGAASANSDGAVVLAHLP